ncbi:Cro/CI family transcriptional regulator [Acinetobacter sp. PFS20]|uniref:Cro/CI family transcriptional regulator n=1 Tax=Acinetobacter sp. PFS20 TaxID=3458434 RepID=UPI003FD44F8A
MTRAEAFTLLSVNGVELAKLLGIKPSAVYQWPEQKIPLAREYQVKDLYEKRKKSLKRKNSRTGA